jgi:hypothetical protein
MNDSPITRAQADQIIRDAREASHPILVESGDTWRVTTRLPAGNADYTPIAAIETGSVGDLVLVDPISGHRLQIQIPTNAAGEPSSIYDAMRRLIDIAEVRDFLSEEGGE